MRTRGPQTRAVREVPLHAVSDILWYGPCNAGIGMFGVRGRTWGGECATICIYDGKTAGCGKYYLEQQKVEGRMKLFELMQGSMPIALALLLLSLCTQINAQHRVGIALEIDETERITVRAGEPVDFELVARSEDGDVVTNWDVIGRDIVLRIHNSTAEHDSSMRSWSADQDAFTWSRLFMRSSRYTTDSVTLEEETGSFIAHYTISRSVFRDGVVPATFVQSGPDSGVVLNIEPKWDFLSQESPPIDILSGPLHHYSLELTSHVPGKNAVYLLRNFEFVAAPHDSYGNILTDRTYPTRIEFGYRRDLDQNNPGVTVDIDSVQHLSGMQGFYAMMRIRRDTARGDTLQWIALRSVEDTSIVTPRLCFDVLDHPPAAVALREPADSTLVRLYDPTDTTVFAWEVSDPPDPFHDIRVSRFDTLRYSDDIRHVLVLVDEQTLIHSIRIESNDHGRSPQRRMSHKELASALLQIIYPHRRLADIIWYVESTDGLYLTASTEMSDGRRGHLLMTDRIINVEQVSPVADFHLGQNYPNPVAGATTIPFGVGEAGLVRLTVHTLLGERVAVLVDGHLQAGEYRIPFERAALSPGTYICHLETSSGLRTMMMSLLR